MKKLFIALILPLLAGCSTINGDYPVFPSLVSYSQQEPASKPVVFSDAGVVFRSEHMTNFATLALGRYNNQTIGAAVTQALHGVLTLEDANPDHVPEGHRGQR